MPRAAAAVRTASDRRTRQTVGAAEVLQMPQPTVSRILTRLGKELGVPVVERRGRTLRLTPAGEALVPHAVAVIAAAHAGVESVRAQETGARGTLTLAFQSTLGERVVPALVKAFLQEHPGVTFELIQTSRPRCLEALDEGSAEIALVSPLAERPDLTTLHLHAESLVLVVPRGHRLATRAKVAFEETATETFVCMKPGYGMRTYLDDLAAAAGFAPDGAPGCAEIPITDPEAVRRIGACWRDGSPTALAVSFQAPLRRRGRRLTEIGLRPHHA